jgi:hypothetical protein
MSELLLDFLQAAFVGHRLACERVGGVLKVQDGLTLEPRVFPRDEVRGTAQVQVDFAVESPRLAGVPFLDSFAGVGDSPENAQQSAAGKFLQGSFHVLVEALTSHDCDAAPVEWEDWKGPVRRWRACSGPLLLVASREGARIEGFQDFFPQLNALFREQMAVGPHWLRVFLGALDGKHMGSEVLVDGEVWPAGQQLLDAQTWNYPAGYASLRHLLIALPAES